MLKLNTIIVDDMKESVLALSNLLEENPYVSLNATFLNSRKLLQYLEKNMVDLLLLDIEMPDINGIYLAEEMINLYPELNIIFITGKPEYALEGYRVMPTDFITKPIDIFRLNRTLKRLFDQKNGATQFSGQQTTISIKVGKGLKFIKINEIKLILKNGRKSAVYLNDGSKVECTESIKSLEHKLERYGFISPNQTCIVPIEKITELYCDSNTNTYYLLVKGSEESIKISANRYVTIKKRLTNVYIT